MNRSPDPHLVSVIIPTYRRPGTVKAAAASALAQTWRALEVVVVSDGPDPETRAALAGLDERLRYFELPTNQGPAAARNAGVAASQGRWLSFLDDDDLMLPRKLQAQMAMADPRHPEVMISCRALYRHATRDDVWPNRPIAPSEDLAEYLLLRRSLFDRPGIIPIQSLLMHRSVVEALPFCSHEDHEDWAWLLEAWHGYGARVVFAWEPLVVYTIDTESLSRSRRLNWADSVAWAQRYRPWIGDKPFCSFLATKAALKARRAGDWDGMRRIAKLILASSPGALELLFLAGAGLLPRPFLHGAWKRSLRAKPEVEEKEVQGPRALSA